jgi:hypothetical protein
VLPFAGSSPAKLEECLSALETLQRLHDERDDGLRICRIQHQPLFVALTDDTAGLGELKRLADFLQLPKALVVRIEQHEAAHTLVAARSRMSRSEAISAHPLLAPLLTAALRRFDFGDKARGFWLACSSKPEFAGGLCGEGLSAEVLDWFLDDRLGYYVAGLVAGGHGMPYALPESYMAHCEVPCVAAACLRDLSGLKALHTAGWKCARSSGVAAAAHGHVDVLQWLRLSGCFKWDSPVCGLTAAAFGQLETLRWCLEDGCPASPQLAVTAAQYGHMQVLRWLVEERGGGWKWNARADGACCTHAARRGDVPMLQYLRAHGCPWAPSAWCAAAEGGHVPALEWMRAAGAVFGADTCVAAAGAGQLHVLEWLRSLSPPCPWDRWTVRRARARGHTAVADWALANGCPELEVW